MKDNPFDNVIAELLKVKETYPCPVRNGTKATCKGCPYLSGDYSAVPQCLWDTARDVLWDLRNKSKRRRRHEPPERY